MKLRIVIVLLAAVFISCTKKVYDEQGVEKPDNQVCVKVHSRVSKCIFGNDICYIFKGFKRGGISCTFNAR